MADPSAPRSDAGEPAGASPAGARAGASGEPFLRSLMDTELYSIGAYFCDRHPELVEEVVERSEEIQSAGLAAYAHSSGRPIEEGFETLLTGLAVRYYKAVAG